MSNLQRAPFFNIYMQISQKLAIECSQFGNQTVPNTLTLLFLNQKLQVNYSQSNYETD